ncbi:glycosyltransferase [Pseudanabaena sp. FACHB-2040]|uniref:glycosyltransferase n=1 Tax=Pseudanabaena sp. FACHB-2040 TaxID=2692859 RepID=UPI0016889730|nr:glycosyltransferase [Pseudanabaena sp. FACHB-2040]MBD2259844.1 glycosyltransferase [Pseudanabaena sp. FACHB-2040]
MRTLYFLVPGTGGRFACGGLFAELKTCELAQQICRAEVVTYQEREPDTPFLDDVLKQTDREKSIFVISWGFHVPRLARRLQGYAVVYHAHSAGYGFKLPAAIPIIAVSRNSMGYWGQASPNSLIYYLPNPISENFTNHHQERDIDVLVQARKSSQYLLQDLVPALQPHCNVVLLDRFVDDLAALFNRTKVYLYDSAEYWAQQRVSEGFGLPPMEAMACGCQVFSSVNNALADYLDPGFNAHKIACYSREWDVARILNSLKTSSPLKLSEADLKPYRQAAFLERLAVILAEVNQFFDQQPQYAQNIPGLTPLRLSRLFLKRASAKVAKKLGR